MNRVEDVKKILVKFDKMSIGFEGLTLDETAHQIDALCQKECQERVERAIAFIESYFVTTVQFDQVKMYHIDAPEWDSVKDRIFRVILKQREGIKNE